MMSQAPSVVFAANGDDNLVSALPDLSGAAPAAAGGASVPSDEAASDAEANAPTEADLPRDSASSVSLRGTTRGLEILIAGTPSTAALAAQLTELFAEAPSFFAGSTARVAIEGALPSGALACLETVATQFEVQIAEIGPVVARRRRCTVPAVLRPDDVPQVHLAEGTGPIADQAVELAGGEPEPASAAPLVLPTEAAPIEIALADAVPSDTASVEGVPEAGLADAAPIEVELANTARFTATPSSATTSSATPSTATPSTATPSSATPSTAAPSTATPSTAMPSSTTPSSAMPSSGTPSTAAPVDDALTAAVGDELASAVADLAAVPPGPRLVIGPVRSGMIVDHVGHVIVIGDVNPGAEVRAEGSIIVLGRLRGVAHAAIGREAGCIIALSLQPQQLRIGRMVARAADADRPSDGAEIAYATGETIVVERFVGRLPSGLAASM
jgi:septum formation inhibitor MinC